MCPQTLRTWPRRRQALCISAHNLFQNNGKRNLFSKNWSDNDAKKKKKKKKKKKEKATRFLRYILFAGVGDKMTKTGTADLMKCASKIYF